MLLCICVKSKCAYVCVMCVCVCVFGQISLSLHVSICVLVGVCGWALCQPLSDSTPSRWRIFVSETNGTERINYRHNAGDMPELPGDGGENKPFPCTLCFHTPPSLYSPPPSPFSFFSSHIRRWLAEEGDMSPLFPSAGLRGAPQGDGTHSRHSPEAAVAPRHQSSLGCHWRGGGGGGHPAAWKHSSTQCGHI